MRHDELANRRKADFVIAGTSVAKVEFTKSLILLEQQKIIRPFPVDLGQNFLRVIFCG